MFLKRMTFIEILNKLSRKIKFRHQYIEIENYKTYMYQVKNWIILIY